VKSRLQQLPEIMGLNDVAEALGCCDDSVRGFIHRLGLPASRPMKRWIIRREAFLRWLEELESKAMTDERVEQAIREARR